MVSLEEFVLTDHNAATCLSPKLFSRFRQEQCRRLVLLYIHESGELVNTSFSFIK
jgi:hypothetical protein